MILRVYRRHLTITPNGFRSVREQMTDYVVQDYRHARKVEMEAERQCAVAGGWVLFNLFQY